MVFHCFRSRSQTLFFAFALHFTLVLKGFGHLVVTRASGALIFLFGGDLILFRSAKKQGAWIVFSQACEKKQVAALPARPGSGRSATCLFSQAAKNKTSRVGPGRPERQGCPRAAGCCEEGLAGAHNCQPSQASGLAGLAHKGQPS